MRAGDWEFTCAAESKRARRVAWNVYFEDFCPEKKISVER
jgi:hypothetical protein